MWKPTKLGVYRLDGDPSYVYEEGGEIVDCCGEKICEDKWSIARPDWQQGAPTVEQLGRWRRWCLDFGYGEWICDVEESESEGHVFAFGAVVDRQSVVRSAPVQPVPGEVLWVPLEVAK